MLTYSPFGYADPFALMRRQMRDLGRPAQASGYPAVNVWQGAHSAAVTAELPGLAPEDIEISVTNNVLTISGERRLPEDGDGASWLRRERPYGRFSRVVQLPFRVDRDRVEARFENGVLEIELHRPEEDKPRRIDIKAA